MPVKPVAKPIFAAAMPRIPQHQQQQENILQYQPPPIFRGPKDDLKNDSDEESSNPTPAPSPIPDNNDPNDQDY